MISTPWKPSKAQLLAARNMLVPDLAAKNLIVLFAGINPWLYTAAIGRHFGRPGNRFWPALYGGGFTPRLFSPFENALLLDLKFGITNIVERATACADEVTDDELRAGAQRLQAKVKRWRPTVVAFVGIGPYRVISGNKDARIGLQKALFGGSHAWVLPNPSGLNAHYSARCPRKTLRRPSRLGHCRTRAPADSMKMAKKFSGFSIIIRPLQGSLRVLRASSAAGLQHR